MPTPKLNLNQPAAGTRPWTALHNDNMDALEARLTTQFAGSPQGNVAGFWVGQWCYDTTNGVFYRCTTATGSAATSNWTLLVNLETFTLLSADAGSGQAPKLSLRRLSGSPAVNDLGGVIEWTMNNSTPSEVVAAELKSELILATPGAENFRVNLRVLRGGTLATKLRIGSGIYTPNATGTDKGDDTINVLDYYEDGIIAVGAITGRTTDDVLDGAADFVPYYDNAEGAPNKTTLRRLSAIAFLEEQTASASAQIDFALDAYPEYRSFFVELDHVLPATDGDNLRVRFSTDGGATFKAGATDYAYHLLSTNGIGSSSAGAASILTNGTVGIGNVADEGLSGEFLIINPAAARETRLRINIMKKDTAGTMLGWQGWGHATVPEDTTDIRFFMPSGNIASGTFRLYGIRG